MKFMSQENWDMHNNAINDWHEDAFQEDIIWLKNYINRDYHGEDDNHKFDTITLKGLVTYNFFRSWPIDMATDTGEIDKQSCMVMFNLKWLGDNGHLNADGQLDLNPGDDKFILNGVTHVPSGDSHISQAYDNPLLFFLILKREEISTGQTRY